MRVSEENNISNWARAHSCNILSNNVAAFCLCPKALTETKLKNNRLIFLVEEVSRQPNID